MCACIGLGGLFAGVMPIGRRNAMLVGFALMAACLIALDRVTNIAQATPLLALASAAWTFPMVNAYPLFVEQIPRERRGVLAALFPLCTALGGAVGDPMNGAAFDPVQQLSPALPDDGGIHSVGVCGCSIHSTWRGRGRHGAGDDY